MAVHERVEGGRAALQCDLLMTVLPGAYLLVANNTAVDLSHAPCYLDLEYQYPYSYVCRFCGLCGQRLFYAQSHSDDGHVESMYIQLLHVLHVHLLRLGAIPKYFSKF